MILAKKEIYIKEAVKASFLLKKRPKMPPKIN